jgi:hypothetical protein
MKPVANRSERRGPKVQRNDPCPCGSLKKFKQCCLGRVAWNTLLRDGTDTTGLLTIRGRNLRFVEEIHAALQLDTLGAKPSLRDYKAAFTTGAVRAIHEAVLRVWPIDTDINAALRALSGETSGLYVGNYDLDCLSRALVRHSTYANKILVVDPFMYPPSLQDEYNPILNPEKYRSETLRSVNFYSWLLPWIEADIVNVIRTPADFDPRLRWESMQAEEEKFARCEALRDALKLSAEETIRREEKGRALRLLMSAPDIYVEQIATELASKTPDATAKDIIAHVKAMRDADPDFLAPLERGKPVIEVVGSTGENYEVAKLTAGLSNSYLVTDLYVRWKEIELDRDQHSAQNKAWAPFAKAVQDAPFSYLDRVSLRDALILREEGRLEGLRSFLRKVWRDAVKGDEYAEENAVALADELREKVREAANEWKQIDKDLLTMMTPQLVAILTKAGPLVASGQAGFLAAATVALGGGTLALSSMRRHGFADKFPAAFFMKIPE